MPPTTTRACVICADKTFNENKHLIQHYRQFHSLSSVEIPMFVYSFMAPIYSLLLPTDTAQQVQAAFKCQYCDHAVFDNQKAFIVHRFVLLFDHKLCLSLRETSLYSHLCVVTLDCAN